MSTCTYLRPRAKCRASTNRSKARGKSLLHSGFHLPAKHLELHCWWLQVYLVPCPYSCTGDWASIACCCCSCCDAQNCTALHSWKLQGAFACCCSTNKRAAFRTGLVLELVVAIDSSGWLRASQYISFELEYFCSIGNLIIMGSSNKVSFERRRREEKTCYRPIPSCHGSCRNGDIDSQII